MRVGRRGEVRGREFEKILGLGGSHAEIHGVNYHHSQNRGRSSEKRRKICNKLDLFTIKGKQKCKHGGLRPVGGGEGRTQGPGQNKIKERR